MKAGNQLEITEIRKSRTPRRTPRYLLYEYRRRRRERERERASCPRICASSSVVRPREREAIYRDRRGKGGQLDVVRDRAI